MPILLQTMPKSVKSFQTVPKTLIDVYILFLQSLERKKTEKKVHISLAWVVTKNGMENTIKLIQQS